MQCTDLPVSSFLALLVALTSCARTTRTAEAGRRQRASRRHLVDDDASSPSTPSRTATHRTQTARADSLSFVDGCPSPDAATLNRTAAGTRPHRAVVATRKVYDVAPGTACAEVRRPCRLRCTRTPWTGASTCTSTGGATVPRTWTCTTLDHASGSAIQNPL